MVECECESDRMEGRAKVVKVTRILAFTLGEGGAIVGFEGRGDLTRLRFETGVGHVIHIF